MPIYEYECMGPGQGCRKCTRPFEVLQGLHEPPLEVCPSCGQKLRKIISRCRAAMVDVPEDHLRTEKSIGEFEKQGMWSHAAELADKHSEKTGNSTLKNRALDNYQKAGYSMDTLERHSKGQDD